MRGRGQQFSSVKQQLSFYSLRLEDGDKSGGQSGMKRQSNKDLLNKNIESTNTFGWSPSEAQNEVQGKACFER